MKKSLLPIMLLCGITLGVFTQKAQEASVGVLVLDEQPQFKGGMPVLQVFVSKNIKLPQEERNNPVNGKWDGEKFVVNFRSNAWDGTGQATIKPLSSNRIEWRCVSNQGEVHVPNQAVLSKRKNRKPL